MNSSPLFDPLNVTAAILMVLNGSFGIVCNVLIVYIFVRAPTERTSFNLICIYRGIGNCFILGAGFLATFVPVSLIGDSLYSPTYQTIIITCTNSTYTGLQYCGVVIAVNRFCAMYFPRLYSTLFSNKCTFLIVTGLFIYRATKVVIECTWNIPRECFTTFSPHYLSWMPDREEKCKSAPSSIVDGSAIILGAQIVMNSATFIKIYFFYKSTEIEETEVKRKMRKNKILFLQTVIQDVTYLIDMLFTYKLSGLFEERYWTFISGTFVWQCVHSFDGLIMIMFNERLTFLKSSFFPSSTHQSVTHYPKSSASVTPSRHLPPVASY